MDTSTATPQIDLRNKDSDDVPAGSSIQRQTHNNNDVTTTTVTSAHSTILNNSSTIGGERIDDDVEFYSADVLIRYNRTTTFISFFIPSFQKKLFYSNLINRRLLFA